MLTTGLNIQLGHRKPASGTYSSGIVGAWKTYGVTNDSTDKSVLKDLTGHGHDIQLKNFSYNLGSGYGKYTFNFTHFKIIAGLVNRYWNKFVYLSQNNISGLYIYTDALTFKNKNVTLKISNMDVAKTGRLMFTNDLRTFVQYFDKDGVYKLDTSLVTDLPDNMAVGFAFEKIFTNENIIIEQIPEYKGGLIFDGVDDYGVCNNMPIFIKEKGYTVCVIAKTLTHSTGINDLKSIVNNAQVGVADGAFSYQYENNASYAINYGAVTNIDKDQPLFGYQTSKLYNDIPLKLGNVVQNTPYLNLSKVSNNKTECTNMVFYALEIYDRDLSPEEIKSVEDRMLAEWYEKAFDPSLIDYQAIWTTNGKTNSDVNKNVPNLIDPTNFLVTSNFLWSVGSGYGEYSQNYLQYYENPAYAHITKTASTIHISEILTPTSLVSRTTNLGTVPSYKVKITGLTENRYIRYAYTLNGVITFFDIKQDGIYNLPESVEIESARYTGFRVYGVAGICDITIEQIPLSDGLVFDGVDDYFVSAKELPASDSFTIVGDITGFLKNNGVYIPNAFYWYSDLIFIKNTATGTGIPATDVIGLNSDGLIVTKDSVIKSIPGKLSQTVGRFNSSRNSYPIMNFHGLTKIAPKVLNEAQIRSVYEYLKTLKANNIG